MNPCPKCGATAGGAACPKCGLVFDRFDPRVLEEGVPSDLLELWNRLVEHWDDRGEHALFLERCLMLEHAGFAAGRYRGKGDDPTALEQIERLRSRLEQTLLGRPKPERAKRRTIKVIGYALLFLAMAAILFFFLHLRS